MTVRIRLSSSKRRDGYRRFTETIFASSDSFQLGRNPLNWDVITVVEKSSPPRPVGCLELQFLNDRIRLSAIEVPSELRGRGYGSRILNFLCLHADEFDLDIEADIDPYLKKNGDGTMGVGGLRSWYLRHGFEVQDGGEGRRVVRAAQPKPSFSPSPQL